LQFVNPDCGVVVPAVAGALRRQLCAAFGATALEHETPTFRGHASTKSVGAGALDFTGLECAFHGDYLDQ
jgi:hypothetical protein